MKYLLDPGHTLVEFSAKHMMLATVKGRFNTVTGELDWDAANPENAKVEVDIDATSISSNDAKRDGHLKSPEFLDVEKYPTIVFKSTKVTKSGDGEFDVQGDLTIRGVTKSVVLKTEHLGEQKSPWGATSIGFSGSTKINRKDYGLEWNVALEAGGWLVGEEVKISIEVEATQPAPVAV